MKFHKKEYPIALLPGMSLVNVREIYKKKYTDIEGWANLFLILVGLPITGLSLLAFIISGIHWTWIFGVVAIFILIWYFMAYSNEFDHYEYDVIINSNVSIYDFYYNYNLVKINGDIWTITTKEENKTKYTEQICEYILNKQD